MLLTYQFRPFRSSFEIANIILYDTVNSLYMYIYIYIHTRNSKLCPPSFLQKYKTIMTPSFVNKAYKNFSVSDINWIVVKPLK
jgi:hypothetical protein